LYLVELRTQQGIKELITTLLEHYRQFGYSHTKHELVVYEVKDYKEDKKVCRIRNPKVVVKLESMEYPSVLLDLLVIIHGKLVDIHTYRGILESKRKDPLRWAWAIRHYVYQFKESSIPMAIVQLPSVLEYLNLVELNTLLRNITNTKTVTDILDKCIKKKIISEL